MDRDLRLTGVFREQTDHVEAPLGFEVNNPWKVCHLLSPLQSALLTLVADGRQNHVKDKKPKRPSDLPLMYILATVSGATGGIHLYRAHDPNMMENFE